MKLTAPPPGSAPETPESPPAESSASPNAPSPAVPYQKPPERVATWPTWFGPADAFLAAAVLALAFLASSFAARNSDIWLHLAAGKRLTTGEYKLGTDPFSYTAADRTWVNHSWLFDLGAYSLFSGEGFLLVLIKALVAAGAFGLLLCIRRAGQPLWPWALFAAIGLLASANLFTLRPYVGSVFFFALTLLLVFRLPSPPGSWKLPIAIGVTFALWSNIDAWFVLGPAMLLLLAVGEGIRANVWPDSASDPADPLGRLPDLGTLIKALIVGSVACMINPHHVGVWELPIELIGAPGAEADPRIGVYFLSPLKNYTQFWSVESLGFNAGGFAYGLLLVAGLYAAFLSGAVSRLLGLGAGIDPMPVPQLVLWLGFVALSLFNMFAIPFFVIVSVPILAARCNAYSSHVKLGLWSEAQTRFLLMGSSAGRLATVVAFLLMGLVSVPGWLHPPASAWWESALAHPATTRRVEWRIEIDPDLKQGAEWLNTARAGGSLGADSHGFAASLDFANYCAWFAPAEKVFANSRIGFHRADLPEFTKARRGLGAFTEKAEPPDPRDVEEVLAKWKAVYVVIARQRTEREVTRLLLANQELTMWTDTDHWSPWFFNGRSAISGWRASKTAPADPSFPRLELDPLVAAYGPNVQRVPVAEIRPPLVHESVWGELFTPRMPSPTGAEEAESWLVFKNRAVSKNVLVQETCALLRLNQPGLSTPVVPQSLFLGRDEVMARQGQLRLPPPPDGSFRTYSILALRAARRAIAENPDHPDGYFALSQALSDRDLPIGDGERSVSLATAYQQCLARLPKPANFRRNVYLASPTQMSESLAMMLLGRRFPTGDFSGHRADMGAIGEFSGAGIPYRIPASAATGNKPVITRVPPAAVSQLPQGSTQMAEGSHILPLDLAQQLLATAEAYARVEFTDPEQRTAKLTQLGESRKVVDASHKKALDQFRASAERNPKLRDRHRQAMTLGLVGEGLNLLNNADLGKEYGEEEVTIIFHLAAMELAIGRLEEGSNHIASLHAFIDDLAAKPNTNKELIKTFQRWLSELEYQKLVLEGNYAAAGKELELLEGSQIGLDELLATLAKEKIDPAKYKDYDRVTQRLSELYVAWPIFPMLSMPVYGPGGGVSLVTGYAGGRAQLHHFEVLTNARRALLNKVERDSQFFIRRGFLALLEGDIAGAKARFASAARPAPPPEWNVKPALNPVAGQFLKQIELASQPKNP